MFKKGDLVKIKAFIKSKGKICVVIADSVHYTTTILEPSGKKSVALTRMLELIQAFNKKQQ